MRVLLLGGCGEVGSEVTRDLVVHAHDVKQLTIADVNVEQAENLAVQLGDSRLVVERVDVTNHTALVSLLKRHDAVMNCLFHGYFPQVAAAVAEARVPYADLISEPTEEERRRLKEAGVPVISGLGLTPGVSNVLAAYGARWMDQLDEVHINWVSYRTIAPSRGLLGTVLWELGEECPTRGYYFNGRFVKTAAFSGSRVVRFAEPLGEQTVYFVPHTETFSIPRHFPQVKFVAVRGTWRPAIMDAVRTLNQLGLLTKEPISVNGEWVPVYSLTEEAIWRRLGGKRDRDLWGFYLNVEMVGRKGAEEGRLVFDVSHPVEWGDRSTARMTGVCAAVGFLLLLRDTARGETGAAGVLDPEEYFEPDSFIAELRKREGILVSQRWEAL